MKKMYLIIMSMAVITFLSCGKNKDDVRSAYENGHSYTMMYLSCSENGAFSMGNDGLLHYVSSDGEDMIYCFDPACKHERASETNQDPECTAAGFYDCVTKVSYHDGYIYFFATSAIAREHKIYKMSVSGGVRELVAELPFGYNIDYIVFDDDYVYYTMVTLEFADDNLSSNRYFNLVEVSLTDGSYRIITEQNKEIEKRIGAFDTCEKTLFLKTSVEECKIFRVIDLETLDVKYEACDEEYLKKAYVGVCDRESFYYVNVAEEELGVFNVNTGEDKVLIKAGEDESFGNIYGAVGRIWYKLEKKSGETSTFFYDESTGKTRDITENCKDLSIVRYDAYKRMFVIRRKSDDVENKLRQYVMAEEEIVGKN